LKICQLLAINTHEMAPRTRKWLQERGWDAVTKGLAWVARAGGGPSEWHLACHPTPYTPTPCTSHPATNTLHSTPYTLHPKPNGGKEPQPLCRGRERLIHLPKSLHHSLAERLKIYCQITGVSAAHAMHCATYCTPCRPLIRAFSGWIRTPPPPWQTRSATSRNSRRKVGVALRHPQTPNLKP
jgi:hypothetical protein